MQTARWLESSVKKTSSRLCRSKFSASAERCRKKTWRTRGVAKLRWYDESKCIKIHLQEQLLICWMKSLTGKTWGSGRLMEFRTVESSSAEFGWLDMTWWVRGCKVWRADVFSPQRPWSPRHRLQPRSDMVRKLNLMNLFAHFKQLWISKYPGFIFLYKVCTSIQTWCSVLLRWFRHVFFLHMRL